MNSITDPAVKARFQAEIAPKIAKFQGPSVASFKTVYASFFPQGGPPGPLSKDREQAAAKQVKPLKDEADKLLAELKTWAAATGIKELSKESIDATLRVEGQRIWKQAWEQAKAQIDTIIGGFSFQGVQVDYRGSAKKGQRAAAKGKTHFDPSDFDVDAFVVHPATYESIVRANPAREQYGKIFPRAGDATAPLLALGAHLSSALSAAFPTIGKLTSTTIVLRREKPRS
jgi:hypothetical protein